jgi:hypothetical protein
MTPGVASEVRKPAPTAGRRWMNHPRMIKKTVGSAHTHQRPGAFGNPSILLEASPCRGPQGRVCGGAKP